MSDPDYRFCVYCGADCIDYDTIEVPHATDCPERTGLYPVRQQEIEPHGFACVDCSEPFALGDFYTLRETSDSLIFEVTCLSCGMLSAVVGYGA